jgi:hypothetical protein
MAVYLYAVCHGDVAAPTGVGLRGGPLRAISAGGLSALVGDELPAGRGESELWQHEHAVEELMDAHDLLPARFGTMLSSDAAVQTLLRRRSHELSSALHRVAGASELSVRAVWNEKARAPRSGADYLQSLAETERRAEALAHMLEDRLARISRARRHRVLVSPKVPVTGAYLVAKEMTGGFVAELERLEDEIADATLLCTGPWPPYSFVDEEPATHE